MTTKAKVIHWPLTKVMTTKGQGHSLTFDQGHSDSTFSNFFSSKNARPFETKVHMEPPWDVGMKICSNVLGYMIKRASRPIYGQNLLLRNQQAGDPADRQFIRANMLMSTERPHHYGHLLQV